MNVNSVIYNSQDSDSLQLFVNKSVQDQTSNVSKQTKLKLVTIKNNVYIESVRDTFQDIRILLLGLFIQAYSHRPDILKQIKLMFNGSNDSYRSIFKACNLNNMLTQVPFNKQNQTEKAVIRIFNHHVGIQIIKYFQQFLSNEYKDYNKGLQKKMQRISKHFDIIINIVDIQQNMPSSMCFYKYNNTILKRSHQITPIIEQQIQLKRRITLPCIHRHKKGAMYQRSCSPHCMTPSISSKSSSQECQQSHVRFKLSGKVPQLIDSPQLKNKIKSNRKDSSYLKNKNQSYSLWDYFCC